jgi:hypothetical protein
MRLALANGDPAAALSYSRGGTGSHTVDSPSLSFSPCLALALPLFARRCESARVMQMCLATRFLLLLVGTCCCWLRTRVPQLSTVAGIEIL